MQEFVRSMCVAPWSKHAAHHHLGFRKTLAEHVHQRDRSTLADVAAGGAEVRLRCPVECLLKPGRGVRCVPASGAAVALERDLGLVGSVVLQQGLQLLHRLSGVDHRRQPQRQLERGIRPQHIAGIFQRRKPFSASHGQRRRPGAIEKRLHRVGGGGQGEGGRAAAVVMGPRKALVDLVPEDRGRSTRLLQSFRRNLAMEAGRQQATGFAVLQPVQHLPHDPEARRHQPRRIAGMHALSENFDLQGSAGHAAQGGGEPQLIVVAGARVQADHQRHITQPAAQRVDVGHQVVRARLLAGFDQSDDARMRGLLRLERLHRRDARVDGVTVVGTATAIQLSVFVLRRPRSEIAAPAGELGLLVEVAVHEHRLARRRGIGSASRACTGRGDLEKQHRRATGQANNFKRQALDLLRLDPAGRISQHGLDVAMLGPLLVEARRLGRNLDVIGDLADDVAVPLRAGVGQGRGSVEHAGGEFMLDRFVHWISRTDRAMTLRLPP